MEKSEVEFENIRGGNGVTAWIARRGEYFGKGASKGRALVNMLNIEKREEAKKSEKKRKEDYNAKPEGHAKNV